VGLKAIQTSALAGLDRQQEVPLAGLLKDGSEPHWTTKTPREPANQARRPQGFRDRGNASRNPATSVPGIHSRKQRGPARGAFRGAEETLNGRRTMARDIASIHLSFGFVMLLLHFA